jgi:hypothetical protein
MNPLTLLSSKPESYRSIREEDFHCSCASSNRGYNRNRCSKGISMSLNLPQLAPQVQQMGETSAQKLREMDGLLPKILQGIEEIVHIDPDLLQRKIDKAGDRWVGAIPTQEPLNTSHPPLPLPAIMNVLGADGSQIHPDRHAAMMYYLINIGGIHIRYGSGSPPATSSQGFLHFREEDLYDEYGAEVSSAYINACRDALELEKLADLAARCHPDPTLAILDNSLLLWFANQSTESIRYLVDRILMDYFRSLTLLRNSGAALAGFIDRPGHASIISLIHLASIDLDDLCDEVLRANPFRGVPDRALFQHLLPSGHRSSIFVQSARLNRDFRNAGHEIHFFYLNLGEANPIARIEIPQWVASSPELLTYVHSGILEQCKTTSGFPYILIRAHELAVVTHEDRKSLESMIQRSLLQQGVAAGHSQKAESKLWTARRRRHRL